MTTTTTQTQTFTPRAVFPALLNAKHLQACGLSRAMAYQLLNREDMSNPATRGRGLCGRFFYVVPPSRLGYRNSTPPLIDPIIKLAYKTFLNKALTASNASTGEEALRMSEEAYQACVAFQDEIEIKLREGGELYDISDWGGKLVGKTMRIAGLLHCAVCTAQDKPPNELLIQPESVLAAIQIGRCLLEHAKAAYAIGGNGVEKAAQYLLRRLVSTGGERLSKRDVLRLTHWKPRELEAPMQELVLRGYIRIEKSATGGRPAETIILNPNAM